MYKPTSTQSFYGEKLRLARLLSNVSLDDLGNKVSASRQYIHQLETNSKEPTSEMRSALASVLNVREAFFENPIINAVQEQDCHFRKLITAPRVLINQAVARGTIMEKLVEGLDRRLRLPTVHFPAVSRPKSVRDVEATADQARVFWGLGGDAPITNVTRVLENAGAVVVHFDDLSDRIDALSIARRRPLVVRSSAKTAAVRLRFDLAHEAGHLIMHEGVVTGDRYTEEQAHRFASAFLIPAIAFSKEFPRSRRNLDWENLYEMKKRWKLSVRAILRRALDLGLIDAAQYRTGNVHLSKTGQTKFEYLDDLIAVEEPELLTKALTILHAKNIIKFHDLISEVGLTETMFFRLTGFEVSALSENVVRFPHAR